MPRECRVLFATSYKLAVVDQTQAAANHGIKTNVFSHSHLGKQGQILPDYSDTFRSGLHRVNTLDSLAEVAHAGTGIGSMHAGDDFDERALATAILTGKTMHLAWQKLE